MSDRKDQRLSGEWTEWGNYVLSTLEKLEDKVDRLEDRMRQENKETNTSLVILKTKAGIIGAISGIIVSAIISLVAGLLLFNLTVGSVNKRHDTTSNIQPHSVSYVLPPRENDEYSYHVTSQGG